MKLPNFLIVGAAKAGTTSIYQYLKQHPEVYMSSIKEPKYFSSLCLDLPLKGSGDRGIGQEYGLSWYEYLELFANVEEEKTVGEASADNLYYHDRVIPFIKNHLGDIKIIIVLRNPVERAFSAYTHLTRDGRETLSFEEALEVEKTRKQENYSFIWFYQDAGFYYSGVKAYIDAFGKDMIKIYFSQDLSNDAVCLMQDIYGFLGVYSTFVPQIRRYNVSGIPKSQFLQRFLNKPTTVKSLAKRLIPEIVMNNLVLELRNRNLKKPEMLPETRRQLVKVYREDIERLENLIERDLSFWLN